MNSRSFKRFFRKHLASELPQFAVQKNLIYIPPLDYVLNAVIFQSSAYNKLVNTIYMYTTPLFMPGAGSMMMLVGNRLGYFDLGEEDEESVARRVVSLVNKKVLPSFSKCTSSPADVIALFGRSKSPYQVFGRDRSDYQDSYQVEALAYAFVLTGQWSEAISTLERLLQQLRKEYDEWPDAKHYVDYYLEWIERVEQMLTLVKTEPPRAVERLEEYRLTALRELGVIK